ncbi:hypothetical protein PV08_06311 [Exophiala spinifera]|uniref:SigF-like NTF2-like domain-containing protein n=1 Tax=Exophiala spinifera TaxID=91928 RepID=A0A0D2BCA7_9EURO|nr:uncharacterized protein PV08_06311 [Exophiala spinifera]KIW16260.1 hypothetical protein PV08_06311 [Exophiala spinifera]
MDDPVAEIPHIIKTLVTAPSDVQSDTIKLYFTPAASFTHPFCRTGSFPGSIWLIIMIYRWYKILSPHVDIWIDSVAFDKEKLLLYVSMHQDFRLWVVPFYIAPVKLVTVLQLTTDPTSQAPDESAPQVEKSPLKRAKKGKGGGQGRRKSMISFEGKSKRDAPDRSSDQYVGDDSDDDDIKYFIQSQDDLYQTSEWIKFILPWGVGVLLMVLWQFWATFLCVVGTKVVDTILWLPRKLYFSDVEIFDNTANKALGPD